MFSRDVNDVFANSILLFKLREVFAVLKMNITTEASQLMSEDQFDVRGDLNLKFKHAF